MLARKKIDAKQKKILMQEELTPGTVVSKRELPCETSKEIFEKTTKFGGVLGPIKEIVNNAFDAIQKRLQRCPNDKFDPTIKIIVEDRIQKISVIDNGYGPNREARDGVSNWGNSPKIKEKIRKTRGIHNTGLKSLYHSANRVTFIGFCREDLKYPNMARIAYTREEQKNSLVGNQKLIEEIIIRPDDCPLPANETGTVVTLEEFLPKRFITRNEMITDLANELDPWSADMIRVCEHVNDPGVPLRKRDIVGEKIEMEFSYFLPNKDERHVSAFLYMPKKKTPDDHLKIGAYDPVCDINTFLANVKTTELRYAPDWLRNFFICGIFNVEEWNKFVAQTRNTFDDDLFLNEKIEIATLFHQLETNLTPKIDEILGKIDACDDNKNYYDILKQVISDFNNTFEYHERIDDSVKISIIPAMKRIEMTTGQKTTLEIKHAPGTSGKFKWEIPDGGLTADTLEGRKITVTAGNVAGLYKVRIYDAKKPSTEAFIKITVVREKHFRISPSSVTVQSGSRMTFRAVNVDVTSKNIYWDTKNCGGEAVISNDRLSVEILFGRETGEFSVEAYDMNDRDLAARASILIESPEAKEKKNSLEPPEIKIENNHYCVIIQKYPENTVGSSLSRQKKGNPFIYINQNHDNFKKTAQDGNRALMNWIRVLLTWRHVEFTYPNETTCTSANKVEEILSKISL